jgi:hypothetical protein
MREKTLEEVMAEIEAKWDGTTGPGHFYSEAGQCRFWYIENVPYYSQRISDTITVYRALDDKRIIGGILFNESLESSCS